MKPEGCTDEMLIFLDKLREDGSVNMFGSAVNLAEECGIGMGQANRIVAYWMATFIQRNQIKEV